MRLDCPFSRYTVVPKPNSISRLLVFIIIFFWSIKLSNRPVFIQPNQAPEMLVCRFGTQPAFQYIYK